jgi:protein O-GlcNAc transferase
MPRSKCETDVQSQTPVRFLSVQKSLKTHFASKGIASDRIQAVPYAPTLAAHLSAYNRVDIALDPFPYNGTTTSCEALWMGVPVLSLAGNRHSARVGTSLLSKLGLHDWVCDSVEGYIDKAVAAAARPDDLQNRRLQLRQTMTRSTLLDANRFAERFLASCCSMVARAQQESG